MAKSRLVGLLFGVAVAAGGLVHATAASQTRGPASPTLRVLPPARFLDAANITRLRTRRQQGIDPVTPGE